MYITKGTSAGALQQILKDSGVKEMRVRVREGHWHVSMSESGAAFLSATSADLIEAANKALKLVLPVAEDEDAQLVRAMNW
jgi:hypothetical protein